MKKSESPSPESADPEDDLFDPSSIPPEVHAAVQALLRAFAKARRPGAASPSPDPSPPHETASKLTRDTGQNKPN